MFLQTFAEIADKVTEAAGNQGLIEKAEVEELSKADTDGTLPAGSVLFGSKARGRSLRASTLFGWKPIEGGLDVEIPRAVAEEATARSKI